MIRQPLPRAAPFTRFTVYPPVRSSFFRHTLLRTRTPLLRRSQTTGGPSPPNPQKPSRLLNKVDRWITRFPTFLQPPLLALRRAPASTVLSFAILHELTAIVPLVGLVGLFHYTQWLPPWFAESHVLVTSVEKLGKWFRKRGWISDDAEAKVEEEVKEGKGGKWFEKTRDKLGRKWERGEGGSRLLVETATAWAVVKVLLPVRLVVCAWWAPGFARWVVIPIGVGVQAVWVAIVGLGAP